MKHTHKIICPFCHSDAKLKSGKDLYPHREDLKNKNFWFCDNNHSAAWAICKKDTLIPLHKLVIGGYANAKTNNN